MKVSKIINDREYLAYIYDLINEQTLSLEKFVHHHHTTRLRHCLNVSYRNYKVCRLLGFDAKAAARAGLLHDFFFYERKNYDRSITGKGHMSGHPEIAFNNASEVFNITQKETDIILSHMWPLSVHMPHFRESVVIIIVDKYCALLEGLRIKSKASRI